MIEINLENYNTINFCGLHKKLDEELFVEKYERRILNKLICCAYDLLTIYHRLFVDISFKNYP